MRIKLRSRSYGHTKCNHQGPEPNLSLPLKEAEQLLLLHWQVL